MKYICSKCGEEHEGWPALAFDSPHQYHNLPDKEKTEIATLDSDFCVIHHSDQTDRFIRAVLFQNVRDHCQRLEYGVWVSVSEKTYNQYFDNFGTGDHEGTYFAYLCNNIPGYEGTLSVKANLIVTKGTQRPIVIPHESQTGVRFVTDYHEGITKAVAEERLRSALESWG